MADGKILAAGTPAELLTEDNVRAVYGLENRVLDWRLDCAVTS